MCWSPTAQNGISTSRICNVADSARLFLLSIDLVNHLGRGPGVSAPDLVDLSILVDQCGGETVRNRATFILAVNGECVGERVDLFFVAGGEGPDARIGAVKAGVIFQDPRRIVGRIERDAEQTRLR